VPLATLIAQGFDAVIDTSGVEMIDLPAYAFMVTHLDSVVALASKVGRVSVVRPAGMTEATVAGMFADGVQRRFRSALFTGPREAFAWLERTDALDVYAALEALLAGIRGTPPMLRELRDLLAAKPRSTLTTVARTLGVSERSLSRRLQELNTTFRAESQRACLCAAEAMLIRGDDKLETIARATGFTSRTHFTTFFQAATGETPSEFRARRRAV
jgi:AraC-like DNA-binding protein